MTFSAETTPLHQATTPSLPPGARIAFVLPALKMGGAEQVVRLLARSMLARHSVLVISLFAGGALAAQFEADGIPLLVLEGQRTWRRPWQWLWSFGRSCRQLRRALQAFQPDIVNAHSLGHTAEVWLATRGLANTSVILTLHNTYPFFAATGWRATWRRRGLSWLFGRFDGVIAISEEVRAWVVQHHLLPSEAVTVVTNGIDTRPPILTETRAQLRARHSYPQPAIIFIQVASLLPKKAHADLLEAIAQMPAAWREQALFLLVGDGPERPRLVTLVSRLGLDACVQFLGLRHDVPELLALSDVMVVASRHEGLSLALMEGMLAGLPVVSTRVSGSTLLVREGENGFLVPPGDPAALSRQLVWCLAHPEALPKLGAAARATINNYFSAERMADDTEAVFAQVQLSRAA